MLLATYIRHKWMKYHFGVYSSPERVMSLKSFRNSEKYSPYQLVYEFVLHLHERFLLNIISVLHMYQNISTCLLVKSDHSG